MTPEEYQEWRRNKSEAEALAAAEAMGENYTAPNNNITNVTQLRSFHPRVLLAEDYEWGAADYLQIPLALVIGGLHALPTASFGYKCSKNTTSARNSLLEAIEYF